MDTEDILLNAGEAMAFVEREAKAQQEAQAEIDRREYYNHIERYLATKLGITCAVVVNDNKQFYLADTLGPFSFNANGTMVGRIGPETSTQIEKIETLADLGYWARSNNLLHAGGQLSEYGKKVAHGR